MKSGLRFRILDRDDFTCQYCGRHSHQTTKLHVDHIIPRSRGGAEQDELLRQGKHRTLTNYERGVHDGFERALWAIYNETDLGRSLAGEKDEEDW
jgi:HNH endonuclease